MNRIPVVLAMLASLLMVTVALADPGVTVSASAREAAQDALLARADLPAKPPTLPSQAAERATAVHENTAFGKKGEAMRAAHAEAGDQGMAAADDAHADAADRAAQGAAASAAGAANADAHAAAGQARADEARKSHSKPPTPPPHGP